MKSEKILSAIPKLQMLNEEKLNLVSSVIDSCLVVQALELVEAETIILNESLNFKFGGVGLATNIVE